MFRTHDIKIQKYLEAKYHTRLEFSSEYKTFRGTLLKSMNISKAFLFCLWGHAKSVFKTINALCIYLSNHRTKRLISPLYGSYQWLSQCDESTESPMIPVMGVGDLSGPRIVRPRVGRPRTRNVGHGLIRLYRLIVFGVSLRRDTCIL